MMERARLSESRMIASNATCSVLRAVKECRTEAASEQLRTRGSQAERARAKSVLQQERLANERIHKLEAELSAAKVSGLGFGLGGILGGAIGITAAVGLTSLLFPVTGVFAAVAAVIQTVVVGSLGGALGGLIGGSIGTALTAIPAANHRDAAFKAERNIGALEEGLRTSDAELEDATTEARRERDAARRSEEREAAQEAKTRKTERALRMGTRGGPPNLQASAPAELETVGRAAVEGHLEDELAARAIRRDARRDEANLRSAALQRRLEGIEARDGNDDARAAFTLVAKLGESAGWIASFGASALPSLGVSLAGLASAGAQGSGAIGKLVFSDAEAREKERIAESLSLSGREAAAEAAEANREGGEALAAAQRAGAAVEAMVDAPSRGLGALAGFRGAVSLGMLQKMLASVHTEEAREQRSEARADRRKALAKNQQAIQARREADDKASTQEWIGAGLGVAGAACSLVGSIDALGHLEEAALINELNQAGSISKLAELRGVQDLAALTRDVNAARSSLDSAKTLGEAMKVASLVVSPLGPTSAAITNPLSRAKSREAEELDLAARRAEVLAEEGRRADDTSRERSRQSLEAALKMQQALRARTA